MITHDGKQVIVVGVEEMGGCAVVHYVEALGTSRTVGIDTLRADTIDELEAALMSARIIPSDGEQAERDEMDELATEY